MAQQLPFMDMAEAAWREAAAAGRALGLVIAELDGYGPYLEFHGAVAAESCVQNVLRCLREQLRGETDRIGAIGGACCAVLLPGAGAGAAADVGERLRAAVAALALPNLGLTPVGTVTLSVGAASLAPEGAGGVGELFAAADRAVRAARREGGDTVRIALSAGAREAAKLY